MVVENVIYAGNGRRSCSCPESLGCEDLWQGRGDGAQLVAGKQSLVGKVDPLLVTCFNNIQRQPVVQVVSGRVFEHIHGGSE